MAIPKTYDEFLDFAKDAARAEELPEVAHRLALLQLVGGFQIGIDLRQER